jgi:DNA invertase Pin-like site-specific DNA recombinase
MTAATPTRAAIYCRISDDRTGRQAGVERQRTECEDLAQRLGWPVTRIYVDNDISASSFARKQRPEYKALCDDISHGRINAVLAWHPDRLHRKTIELEHYIDLCRDGLCANATVQAGHWDLSTPSGRMTARTLGNVATYESEHKSERIRSQKAQAAKAGEHNGGIRCFGYEQDGTTVREAEAAEIRRLADAVRRGVSLRSLARELNQRGVSTTGNSQWTQSQLRAMLLAPRLIGMRAHQGKIVAKGQWPAILDETTWEAMKNVITDPKRRSPGPRMGRTPSRLGTGLYICGICGQPRLRLARNSSGVPIYKCGGSKSIKADAIAGPHVSRNADKLDAYVTQALIGRLSQPGFVQAMADAVVACNDSETRALVAERDEIREALDEIAATLASPAAPVKLITSLTAQAQRLTARAEEISHLIAQTGERSPVEALIGADDIESAWHALPLATQRAILSAVVTVTVLPSKAGPYFDSSAVALSFRA